MLAKIKSTIQKPTLKSLISIAIPIILANLFQAMYQMTDSFWLGRLGDVALASVSICSPIIFLTVSLGIGFAVAGSTLVAQYFGAKNHQMISHAAAQTILMIILTYDRRGLTSKKCLYVSATAGRNLKQSFQRLFLYNNNITYIKIS